MIYVITGGSGSGKSEFAENIAVSLCDSPVYIATMADSGEESKKRIARHRKMRENKNFITVERYTDIGGAEVFGTALIECISNLVANEMFLKNQNEVSASVVRGIEEIISKCENTVIVTNEVFSDGIEYDDTTLLYMKNLAEVNRRLMKMADIAFEVVYGIGVRLI